LRARYSAYYLCQETRQSALDRTCEDIAWGTQVPHFLKAIAGVIKEALSSGLERRNVLKSPLRAATGRTINSSEWSNLLDCKASLWNAAQQLAQTGPRVLIATSLGGYDQGVALETVLAVALTLRGARVDILLCDEFLPACQMDKISMVPAEEFVDDKPVRRCKLCIAKGRAAYEPIGLPILKFSQFIKKEQVKNADRISASMSLEQIGSYRLDGLSVGEHAYAGALRYFGRGDLNGEPTGTRVLRRYLKASLLSVYAIQGMLEQNVYDVACFSHGIYVPYGLIGEVCRQRGVRVVNWNPAYRKHCFIFSHGDTYHHTMISEATSEWENIPWTCELEKETLGYLKSRWRGTEDWIWFHEDPHEEISQIAKEVGMDFSRPCIGMLTSVMWDARLHYRSNAFPNMIEWVLQTIAYFAKRPELQLVIRVHPAEIRGMIPSRQPIIPEIQRVFPSLPRNVFVIPPESRVSTYVVMNRCNSVIIYNTKTGIEISSMGIPVIVAGEAWIRNKGFSLDASTPTEYFQILDRLPLDRGLNRYKLERARKYAFHFFFRRMVPLPFITSPQKYKFAIQISDLEELLPGRYPGLDVICDGILHEKPFIYPAERLKNGRSTI
jgi:hypothetical protein